MSFQLPLSGSHFDDGFDGIEKGISLSTPSLGITAESYNRQDRREDPDLSTPSLGITSQYFGASHRGTHHAFQLPLSGSLER